jgi:ribosome-binding protein aMBF1 (putative translation factor)
MMTRSRPFEEYHEKQMRDPEYAAAYRALEPEFEIAQAIIRLRTEQGLSQQELAEKMHTGQPNISRLERANSNPSLHFLQRVAEALDSELEVRFKPIELSSTQLSTPGASS